ncbi:hypothetical protein ACOSQ2_006763 [Xanthoceras sorbifolium]
MSTTSSYCGTKRHDTMFLWGTKLAMTTAPLKEHWITGGLAKNLLDKTKRHEGGSAIIALNCSGWSSEPSPSGLVP